MKSKSLIIGIGALLISGISAVGTYLGLSSTGALRGDKIDLVYSLADYSTEYNGSTIIANEEICPFELIEGDLLQGHTEVLEYTGERLEVGVTKVDAKVKIIDKEGFDVSSEYSIKVNPAKLVVSKREVVMTVDSSKIQFSGQDFEAQPDLLVVLSGSLVYGDKLVPSISFSADKTNLSVDAKVFDVFGNNKTSNYSLQFEGNDNSIAVAKLPLLIEPVSTSKEYDGKELTFSEYKIKNGTLLSNHHLEVIFDEGIINVDESGSNFKIKEAYVYDENGNNVSDMYNIDISTKAALTIRSVSIPVRINHIEKTYDGSGFSEEEITLNKLFSYTLPEKLIYNGFSVEMSNYEKIKQQLMGYCNVSEADIGCKFELVKDGISIANSNYKFEITENTYKINPCYIHVSFRDLGKTEYDSKGIEIKDAMEIVDNFYIESGSSVTANDEFAKMSLDFVDEKIAKEYFKSIVSIGNHFYSVKMKLVDKDGNENKNFEIIYDNRGRIEITKINLKIVGLTKEYQYNGKNQRITAKGYESCSGNLMYGNFIEITYKDEQKNVGEKECNDVEIKILSSKKEDFTDKYYSYDYIPGKIIITKKELIVKNSSESITITYGDEIDIIEDNRVKESKPEGFVEGETLEKRIVSKSTDYVQYRSGAGRYKIFYSNLTSTDEKERQILENYEVKYIDLDLVVEPKEVELQWGETSFVYNGKQQIPTCELNGIFVFDECRVNIEGFEKDAGNYEASATYLTNQNYCLPKENSIVFKIKKAELRIIADDQSIEYGETVDSSTLQKKISYEGFIGNDNLSCVQNHQSITLSVSPADAENPLFDREIRLISDPTKEVYSDNYEIIFVDGTLTTRKAKVYVKMQDNLEVVYGTEFNSEKMNELYNSGSISITLASTGEEVNKELIDISGVRLDSKYYATSNVGTYSVKLEEVRCASGVSVYEFEYIESFIEVCPLSIGVSIEGLKQDDSNIRYNGKDITFYKEEFKSIPDLKGMDRFEDVTIKDAYTISSGSYVIKPKIVNSLGIDVTKNYDIDDSLLVYQSRQVQVIDLNFEYVVKQFDYYEGIDTSGNDMCIISAQYALKMVNLLSTLGAGDRIYYEAGLSYASSTVNGDKAIVVYNLVLGSIEVINARGEDVMDVYYNVENYIIGKIIIRDYPTDKLA